MGVSFHWPVGVSDDDKIRELVSIAMMGAQITLPESEAYLKPLFDKRIAEIAQR